MGHITIEIKKDNDMLICAVEDNGIGIQNKANISNIEKQSLGIKTKLKAELRLSISLKKLMVN